MNEDIAKENMVGVARIELATPAMSTQCFGRNLAKMRHFLNFLVGTSKEQYAILCRFHRSYTGRLGAALRM